ncbi:MAG: FAD-linked oxidase C-terminal domain-containing protein [Dehalococcoidia bacterium]
MRPRSRSTSLIQRRVSGYNLDAFVPLATDGGTRVDLTQAIVGSEGTLAVITEATVRLVPLPAHRGIAAAHFPSVIAAAEGTLVALELAPAAIEMVDARIIRACRARPGFASLASFVQGDPGGLLLIECFGDTAAEVEDQLARASDVMRARGGATHVVTTTDAAQQASMWRMREAGLGLLMSVRGDAKPMALVEDTAVAPEHLPRYLARFEEIVARYGTEAGYYGHASVGCLHIRPLVNPKSDAGLRDMQALASDVADLVLEFGGSLSGEHGDGILRGVFTERMFGAELTRTFAELKRAWDPAGILNPGKIIETPAFEDYLRVSPRTTNLEPRTFLDFTREGGFARAIEQCNGQGACRKEDGTMCPSFMVTRDEEHSTRGRANLLRMAISGMLPADALAGPEVAAALDLCVECKACAVECPSGVDMAKLKYEVLAQRHEVHGVPLRDRAFAHIALLARLASPYAPLVNALARLAPVRSLLGRFGVHPQRPLPRLARQPFRRWFAERTRATPRDNTARQDSAPARDAPRGEIVLVDDTFMRWFHPEVGQAATRVLEALGYRVVLAPDLGCCGRPMISKGLLRDAREAAQRNVEALRPYLERGVVVVGTEPSCLLTFREEYPDLLGERARDLARGSVLLDELVARLLAEDPSAAACFDPARLEDARVALHTHCHQKAGPGIAPTLSALRGAGYEASAIDSACCGMAGSFGFEREHYEVSRQMGALRLFPAVEALDAGCAVGVTGTSCRQQIDHFTGATPLHSAELLAAALRS